MTTIFFGSDFSIKSRFVIVYRINRESVKCQLEELITAINLKPIRKSAVSIDVVPSASFATEDLTRLREIKFDRQDIVELVFNQNGEMKLARLKKEGNKTLSLSDFKNTVGKINQSCYEKT